jgi:conjugative relaxase-like TrwC/TraI family protein
MLNITKISDAGQAHAYYSEKDDYYLADKKSAVWSGAGAERLGLQGEIKPADLKAVLQGKAGDQQVGKPGFRQVRQSNGTMKKIPNHMPGLDLTFSAPKSISIAALARGDRRLIEAHDRAVSQAMEFIERHGTVTRQRGPNGEIEHRQTGNLIAGKIRHSTNREGEPQVHTHVVVPNMTYDAATDQWRSLDTRRWRELMREADTVYQAELGRAATAHGYNVDWRVNRDGFVAAELVEVSQAERDVLSTRRKQIDEAIAARGETRESASRKARDTAALDTRAPKDHIPDAERKKQWLDRLSAVTGRREYRLPSDRRANEVASDADSAASKAVRESMDHLGERSARFTERELEHHALVLGDGRIGTDDVRRAISVARQEGELLDATTQQRGPSGELGAGAGLTTKAGQRTERDMLDSAAMIASRRAPLTLKQKEINARIAATENASGYAFTPEQRAATAGILGGGSSLSVVQGYAGTSKTSSVMAAVADAARERGMRVRAIAPTNSAADTLGKAIGAESSTVASINSRPLDRDGRKEAWLVDEAGMVSARDMRDLLSKAQRADAQVVLTGDIRQIDSVGAGRAFAQLQAAHAGETYDLTDIKRQQNEELRQAVYDSLRGDFDAALGRVETQEVPNRNEAVDAVAGAYMRHANERKDTIVATLSRQDRADVNAEIQRRLEAAGTVTGARDVPTLQPKQWTGAEQSDASRYRAGDVIEAHRNFGGGPEKGKLATVTGVENGRVVARTEDGREWRFDPGRTDKFSVHERGSTRIGEGDQIVARGGLRAEAAGGESVTIKNNERMRVTGIEEGKMGVQLDDGRRVTIATGQGAKVDLAYAQTANQAQGRTVDVAVAYMRSSQTNLADRQHAYVALSRAREHVIGVTDNREKLAKTLSASSRGKDAALDDQAVRSHLDGRRPLRDWLAKFAADAANNGKARRYERKVEKSDREARDRARDRKKQEKLDAKFLKRGAQARADEIHSRAAARTKQVRKTYNINVDMGVLGQLLGSKQTSRGHARLAEIRRQRDASLAQLMEAVGRAQERQMQRAEQRAAEPMAGMSGKDRGPKLG